VEADLTDDFAFPGPGDYGIRFIPPHFQDVQFIPVTTNVIARLNRKILNPHKHEKFGSTNCTALENSKIQNAIFNNNGAKQLSGLDLPLQKDLQCSIDSLVRKILSGKLIPTLEAKATNSFAFF